MVAVAVLETLFVELAAADEGEVILFLRTLPWKKW